MPLCQLAQYADTLMQLGNITSSTSKKTRQVSEKRDGSHEHTSDRAHNQSDGRRNEAYAMLAQLHGPSIERERSPVIGSRRIVLGTPPPSNQNTVCCCVCLSTDYTMDQCLFAANEDMLVVVREANWKNIVFSSARRSFRPVWHGKEQGDARKDELGQKNQARNEVLSARQRGSP